ncbi:PREDICTED: crocetin glucosyltransferase, chloroplastic-like [Nelumbo nucifera]|uniref:Glycosyltransferase n=1 Tax=Nelumbo nucifera TaxID=4432 RepID=A0A1U7Z1N7_NELNU|nr:PREDICTED: crocetin glucosyltransferase, chloroplastic-like [Nelumbo nucifera]
MGERPNHFLLVTLPMQGHINPTLQFAKRLLRTGAQVTFAISFSAYRRLMKSSTPIHGLTFAPFSDGFDDGYRVFFDEPSEFKLRASQALADLILAASKEHRPVTCLIYTLLLSWAADVANNLGVASALLWIQSAAVFDIYYHYFNGFRELIANSEDDPLSSIELPGLPRLTSQDVPSFLLPSNFLPLAVPGFQEQFQSFERETKIQVLINTFDAMEPEALGAIDKINMIGIGPLIPSAFLDDEDPSDKSFGGDLFHGSGDYIEWLNSKPDSSVVYVSFGSLAVLQTEEIANGLLESGRPFLWVIRLNRNETGEETMLGRWEELKERGLIVPWCTQVEVLSHSSVGCFVTHCGWNSTLESLVAGVPVVTLPQISDQTTNSRLIEDVWRTGVRTKVKTEEGIVESGEIKRCLDLVMGSESGNEMTRNVKKWKEMSKEAVKDGGSSDKNLKRFLEEIVMTGI